jgi:predicted ArsR family transcriptional regulator
MADQSPTTPHDDWRAVTSLGEPTRRALYDYVVNTGGWVGRDQAAEAVGLERGTAVHHLDRLAADGLLDVSFQRLTGRQGPGAGRPAKLYRRSSHEFDVSLPPRDYELAGRMLAEAVDRARTDGVAIEAAVADVAHDQGARLAAEARARLDHRAKREARRRALLATLADHGYEPEVDAGGTVVLKNCPFHRLARTHTDLVCGMNLCLLDAAVATLDRSDFDVALEPAEGLCCVRLRASP